MRKALSLFALMILLLPLNGCFGAEGQKALDEALTIRGEYLSMSPFSSQVQLRADYGQRVYNYTLDLSVAGEEIVLTVTEPELIAGVTARTKAEETVLEYDGLCLETGSLDKSGLTPISALPAMLRAVREEYLTSYSFEEDGSLRVSCGDPDLPLGTGTEYTLWFHPETHDLTRGEISVDGSRRVSCTLSPFTKE